MDAASIAAELGLGGRINTVMQACFFALADVIPLDEAVEAMKRSIGEVTDIVEKEMYTFEDRNGESLTLRPEATAGMVRAGMTNGLFHNQKQKLWTAGPMFRYEKPQDGRYRRTG